MSYYDVMSRDFESPPGERGRRRRRRRRGGGMAVLVALLVVLAVLGGLVFGGIKVLGDLFAPAKDYVGEGTGTVEVQIMPGQSVRSIGDTLAEADVVASAQAFVNAAAGHDGAESIQPGFYRLRAQMKASLALAALLDPESRIGFRVTVQEGLRLSAALKVVAEDSELDLDALTAAAKDTDALGLPAYAKGKLEGFLFPATYDVEPDTSPESLLADMVAKFDAVAADIDLEARAADIDRTPYQIVVIASIIQAEARHAEDFAKVARVIYNRLDRGMKLSMDSTVKYVTGKGGVTTTAKDRDNPSRYNTYKWRGLPPGPINAPGQQALDAALNPANGAWLYFVTINPDTGETKFAETDDEHARNVAEFQAWLREH